MLEQKTLDQIFEVLRRVRKYHAAGEPLIKAYQRSVREVAKLCHIRYQTMADGCRRRLKLTDRDEFLHLLDDWIGGDSHKIRRLLKDNVYEVEHSRIDKFFEEYSERRKIDTIKSHVSPIESETEVLSFRIEKKIADQMKIVAKMKGTSVPEWLARRVREIVEVEYVDHFKKIIENMSKSEKLRILKIVQRENLTTNSDDPEKQHPVHAGVLNEDKNFEDYHNKISICRNKASGKNFVHIEQTSNGESLFVTPQGKIKALELSLFDELEEDDERSLLSRGLITKLQVKQYHEFIERASFVVNHSSKRESSFSIPDGRMRITQNDLIIHIIEVLRNHGGKARKSQVDNEIYRKLRTIFEARWYHEPVSNQVPRWKHSVAWAKEIAKHQCLIKYPGESGRGNWELTEKGKNWGLKCTT